ncbi:MAG: hypothetical protein COV45_07465 [Deltaproteobacteria bacterium CG11_big_fil_rev_8_21_14_0_20_47_16]|nr:MAG: hypothetical protein COV45_07465 [Deltaproteobacteria bacterium CG11_big_fil_rev_8_21_14_0_20_47_16]
MTAISYKTSIPGKADTATQTPNNTDLSNLVDATQNQPPQDSYVDQLTKLGYAKMGKSMPSDSNVQSTDPVGDMMAALNQFDSATTGSGPFKKISAESVLSSFPDSPEDVLDKFKSVATLLKSKLDEVNQVLASGKGNLQQLHQTQQFKGKLEDLLSFYNNQVAKVAAYVPVKNAQWQKELTNFQQHGGSAKPENFDLDGDGWIGKPGAPGSYRIGVHTYDKKYTDPVAKKLGLKCDFKKGDTQSWAINPETKQRVMFDPISKKVVNEQIAAPDYIANLGNGFNSLVDQADGKMTLTVNNATGTYFAEAGLELHTPEYIYVETDADGEVITPPQVAPFKLENGALVQDKPEGNYKQVYIKEMRVSSERGEDGTPGGDITVEFRGGLDGDTKKILSLRIKGTGDIQKATDVALAITSGDKKGDINSYRETPVIIDAGSYESTCRAGINNFSYFDDLENKDPNNTSQINDTLDKFRAVNGSEINSVLNRGITFKTKGHISGTNSNDLYIVEEPADYLGVDDPAYTTVIEGGKGNNALFAEGKGSLFANGITLASKESGDAEDTISIGINPYGYKKDKTTGIIQSAEGESSNKIYMHINAMNSTIQVENAPDIPNETNKPGVIPWESDDIYDVHGKEVHVVESELDTDVSNIQGLKVDEVAGSGDFTSGGSVFDEKVKGLEASIGKPASNELDEFQVEGENFVWQQGKHYQEDKNMLDGFFTDFSSANLDTADPFKQLEDLDKKVS